MNAQTIQAINQWASQIQNAVVSAAPRVWNVATAVKRADCIGALITNGLIALVAVAIALAVAAPINRLWAEFLGTGRERAGLYESETHFNYNLFFPLGIRLIVTILAVGTACTYAFPLFDQWLWIGAVNPSLAVSHDVMLKVLSSQ